MKYENPSKYIPRFRISIGYRTHSRVGTPNAGSMMFSGGRTGALPRYPNATYSDALSLWDTACGRWFWIVPLLCFPIIDGFCSQPLRIDATRHP